MKMLTEVHKLVKWLPCKHRDVSSTPGTHAAEANCGLHIEAQSQETEAVEYLGFPKEASKNTWQVPG